ncbi:hypothetical protein V6N13_097848 [Hibiscus sabdariffa]
MKAASSSSSNVLHFPPIVTKKTLTQQSPTRLRRIQFFKLGQSFSNNPFPRSLTNPFSSFLPLSMRSSPLPTTPSEIVIDGGGEAETLERTDSDQCDSFEWLGGYDLRGIHADNFLVELRDLLCLDPISILDQRIVELENGLATWGSDKEEDDCERCFIFQTFSNIGWLGELIHPMLI